MKPFLSIIIPVYNEEDAVFSSVNNAIEILSREKNTYEIIIVDDGSTDRSREILLNHFSNNENIRLNFHKQNEGFGAAIRTGIEASNGDSIWCLPVDSPLNQELYNSFKPFLGKADIIVGYREERKGYSLWMRLNSKIFHLLISSLFSMSLKDYNWIHVYSSKVFQQIEIESNGIFMLAEVLIKADRQGFSIIETPVVQPARLTGVASASKIKNIIKTLLDIIRFKIYASKMK